MNGENMGAEQAARLEADREHLEFFRGLVADGNLLLGTLGFGIRIDRGVSTPAFYHKKREVLINPEFVEKQGLTKEQKRYVFGHEIAHFIQLVQDSDTYLETFKIAEKKSKEQPGEHQSHVQQAWNRFFNVFLDIHDNAIVDARSMWAQNLPEAEHPRQTLYKNLTSDNLVGSPKTEQFNFSLLRKVMMGVDLNVKVDDDVAAILDAPFKYGGVTFPSVAHFAKKHFFDAKLPLAVWLSKLQRTLAPIFESLLRMDVESRKIQNQTRSPELTGGDQDGDELGKVVEGLKKTKQSGSERAQDQANKNYENKMKGEGLSEGEISRLQEIRERTREVFPTLIDLWGAFVQKHMDHDVVLETGFVSGENVDIDAFVREIPTLYTEPDRARIMERHVNEPTQETEKPKAIHLFLVLDLSGSMDADKRHAVQEVAYSLSRSLIQFQRDKKILSDDDAEVFDINLRLIGFGSRQQDLFVRTPAEVARKSLSVEDAHELEARLARSVLDIGSVDLGGTCDDGALQETFNDVSSPETKAQFYVDDGVAVVIEITDGDTSTAAESQQIVTRLNKQKNVFALGIKIPGLLHTDKPVDRSQTGEQPDQEKVPDIREDQGVFDSVWGEHGKQLDDLSSLKDVMIKILFAALKEKQANI